jgi:hypothetical protein
MRMMKQLSSLNPSSQQFEWNSEGTTPPLDEMADDSIFDYCNYIDPHSQ